MSFDRLPSTWLGENTPNPEEVPRIAGTLEGKQILAPLLTPEEPVISDQIKVAATLAEAADASLYITSPITVPEQTPREIRPEGTDNEATELLNWALTEASKSAGDVNGSVLYSRRLTSSVLQTIAANDIDTVVLPGTSPDGFFSSSTTERIATHADCNVVVANGRPGFESIPSILLPIAGGPHSGLAADIAQGIATSCNAWIDILHVVEDDGSDMKRESAEEYVEAAYHRIARPETTTTWILETDDPTDAIIEQSQYYPLTIIGAPTKGRLRHHIYGSTNKSVRSQAQSVVLSARNNNGTSALTSE